MGRSIDISWHGQCNNKQQAQTPTVYIDIYISIYTVPTDTLDFINISFLFPLLWVMLLHGGSVCLMENKTEVSDYMLRHRENQSLSGIWADIYQSVILRIAI